ncbi:MAG: hypothetical protein LBM08_03840 [Dysgonamonadaceae bacterium]|jgi:hypothetical protein|nr:hypothetical protein [Dysgonamonadaceae bacterium]
MKAFEIAFKRLVVLLLPIVLRKPVVLAFLNAAVAPVETLYGRFLQNRSDNLYRLRTNGQVCYLRRALNDAFPDANGAIAIYDSDVQGEWQWAWDEDYDTYHYYLSIEAGGTLFWDKLAILAGVNAFTVAVPASLAEDSDNIVRLKSILDFYKLLSKTYYVVYL